MAATALMTVEDFVHLETSDNEAYELVDGELSPLASSNLEHCIIRRRIEILTNGHLERSSSGGVVAEFDCITDNGIVRRPDVSVFLGSRWTKLDRKSVPAPYPPDIAAEILSPSEHAQTVNRKVREYLANGSQEVWILDPDLREIQVRTKPGIRLLQPEDTLETPLLPGFSVKVSDLFAD